MKYLFRVWIKEFCISNKSGALAIIILLALGMGGTIAVFNPIYSLIAAPLPFPQPDRLVQIGGKIPILNVFTSKFEKRELLNRIFTNLTAYTVNPDTVKMSGKEKNVDTKMAVVTEEFFETMGVQPIRGSSFVGHKDMLVLIISQRFWQKELMGADDVIGKPILLSGVRWF